jgi:Transmembrane secretion effector
MMYLAALKGRPFRLLWAGQTISSLGDYLYQVALAWWVLERTGSATLMGSVLICSMIPMLLFLLLGGVAVDRLPRPTLMIASDLARGVICVSLTALATTQQLAVWHIFVASVLFGIVDAFFQPAYAALVPEITPPEARSSANALTSLSMQLGRIGGPLLGAAIIAASGPAAAFALDAASFFLSAALLLPLRALPAPRAITAAAADVVRDLHEGIAAVFGTPWLAITIGVVALTNVTLGGPYQVALPFLVDQRLGGGVHALGLLYAAFPLGYVASGLWLGRRGQLRRRGWLLHGMLAVAGLGMLALGLPIGMGGALVAAVVNGAALEVSNLTYMHAVQELVPNERRGRVASVELFSAYGMIPVGFVITGWATSALGAATVCLIGGAGTVAIASLGLLHPAIRRVD